MNNSPLELLAKKYGNVIKRDVFGNVTGIFVKFPKMKSSDLAAELPNHTHPAFIINGVEQDYILLGKYKAGVSENEGAPALSLPNLKPCRSISPETALSQMQMAGAYITGMTVADYGFIKLLAQKMGWKPQGNTAWGQAHQDATAWKTGEAVSQDDVRAYSGYLYTCLQAHTTSVDYRPDIAPEYWRRGDKVGGTTDGEINDQTHQASYRTMNGSGPLTWRLGGDPALPSDLIGSSKEYQYGFRVVNCELQILPDNNAASYYADLSSTSGAWKAILPNANDAGHTLVAPGTAGTLKWNYVNGHIVLDTQCDSLTLGNKRETFTSVAGSARLAYVPHIVKELGLIRTTTDDTPGSMLVNFTEGEFLASRGGDYDDFTASGLGSVNCGVVRGSRNSYNGFRPRAQ